MPTTEVGPKQGAKSLASDVDRRLDEAIEESLPASDPPAISDPRADQTAVAYGREAAGAKGKKIAAMIMGSLVLALGGWLGRRMMRR